VGRSVTRLRNQFDFSEEFANLAPTGESQAHQFPALGLQLVRREELSLAALQVVGAAVALALAWLTPRFFQRL
jgi:hypothetical protein